MLKLPSRSHGFTLLEMSIVLLIIATLAGGAATMLGAYVQKSQLKETLAKMQTIQDALYKYRLAFDRLPCPANSSYATSSQYYGVEASEVNSNCFGGTPTGDNRSADKEFVNGAVPTKTLGLPDDTGIDGWGRKIEYVVDIRSALTGAFASLSANYITVPEAPATTRMTVNDAAGNSKTTKAMYVLISFGPNGHGAYARSGSGPINAASTNTDELNNCDCNSSGVFVALDKIYVQKPATTSDATDIHKTFDDIVFFGAREDLRSSTE